MKLFQKSFSLLANFSLFINLFLPYLAIQPAYAQAADSSPINSITYNDSSHQLNISKNVTDETNYQLFYKTNTKIDSIAGSKLPSFFYIGTCSGSDCLSQNFESAILKIKIDSGFYYYYFTLKNNETNIVKQGDSTQFDLTDEENNLLENKKISDWTFENVELNKEYTAPQNSGVKLTFTKLPSISGNIKIEEITLTPEQIKQTGSLSDKAYDITSDMVDGTFSYNLSLPIPESSKGKGVSVKFAEELSSINTAKNIENSVSNTDTSVSVKSLDHFTIFVVTTSSSDPVCIVTTPQTCFQSIQAAIDAAGIGDTINIISDLNITSQINITKAVFIEGNNHTLFPQFTKTGTSNNSVIGVSSSNVTIQNLKINGTSGTNLHGLNLYLVNNVIFDNLTVSNNEDMEL